jgi:hypothetical protein
VTTSDRTFDPLLDNEGLWSDEKTAITVTSGERVNPLAMRPDDININDIAHALSRTCRYNGHVGGFLSVARHSLWVERQLHGQGVQLRLHGLLHDAAEAYLGDLVRPLKHGPTFGESYLAAEAELERVIAVKWGLVFPWPEILHQADNAVLLDIELGGPCCRWTWNSTPDDDEQAFLMTYHKLIAERRATR